ncbi:neuralized-like protein 2 [Etheostoma cragini]|uniref:neuralized-like protein 2 n=1 Tax=Etheostoma cragini TaxID=417921 RepID=UPI00155E4532|nr:neuralized-like protein 2 [Etheostoma cragini]
MWHCKWSCLYDDHVLVRNSSLLQDYLIGFSKPVSVCCVFFTAIQLQMEPFPDQFMEFHPIHGTNVRLDYSGTQATRVESFANGVCFSKRPLKPGEIFLIEIEDKELGWCGHLRVGLTAKDPRSLEVVPEYSIPDLTDSGDSWIFAITRNHNKIVEDSGAGGQEAGDGGLAGGRRLGRGEVEDGAVGEGDGGGGNNNNKPKTFFTDSHLHIENVRIPRDKLVGRSRPGRYSHILDDLYKTNCLPPTARRSRIGVLYVLKGQDLADMHMVINGEDMGASAKGIPSTQPLHAVVDVFAATKCVRIVQVEYGFSSLQTLCRKAIQKHIVHRMAIDWLELPEALKHYCKYE